jgi:hypothetical protein
MAQKHHALGGLGGAALLNVESPRPRECNVER